MYSTPVTPNRPRYLSSREASPQYSSSFSKVSQRVSQYSRESTHRSSSRQRKLENKIDLLLQCQQKKLNKASTEIKNKIKFNKKKEGKARNILEEIQNGALFVEEKENDQNAMKLINGDLFDSDRSSKGASRIISDANSFNSKKIMSSEAENKCRQTKPTSTYKMTIRNYISSTPSQQKSISTGNKEVQRQVLRQIRELKQMVSNYFENESGQKTKRKHSDALKLSIGGRLKNSTIFTMP